MSLGNKLAQARKKQNLTQEQLAEKLGVTRQAVSRWESDAAYPETDKIVRMAQIWKSAATTFCRTAWTKRDSPLSPR